MRQTKNKNLTKQILTLMLAFVMVFTGMGIGSWGVDEAWADGLWTSDGLLFEVVRLGKKYHLSLPAYEKVAEAFKGVR